MEERTDLSTYEWPETDTNVGRCKGCELVRPLMGGLCRGCHTEITYNTDVDQEKDAQAYHDEDMEQGVLF